MRESPSPPFMPNEVAYDLEIAFGKAAIFWDCFVMNEGSGIILSDSSTPGSSEYWTEEAKTCILYFAR